MAWGGKAGRLSGRFVKGMYRKWRVPSRPDNPRGVPRYIMRTLANERLSSDPAAFNLRLQQLLTLHELNKGG